LWIFHGDGVLSYSRWNSNPFTKEVVAAGRITMEEQKEIAWSQNWKVTFLNLVGVVK